MSTPESAVAPQPLTEEQARDEQRKELSKALRRLADQCDAGRLPKFGAAWTEVCEHCSEEHPMTVSYTEDRATTAYLALIGVCDMLVDGIRQTIKHMAFHAMIHKVRAMHEAAQATKQ